MSGKKKSVRERRKEVRAGIKARLKEIDDSLSALNIFMSGCYNDDAYRGYSSQRSELVQERIRLEREYKAVNDSVR